MMTKKINLKIIERLVLDFYPGSQILSPDQEFWCSEFYREFLRFIFDAEMMKRSEASPVVVFVRGNILGPRCLNVEKAPGLPKNTCVIIVNLTLLEFISQTLISITFKNFKERGQEAFLKDAMVRICQVSWPDKFRDFKSAYDFLRGQEEFDDLLIDNDGLILAKSVNYKIANSIKKELNDIYDFEPNWIDTISNQYFSIIFHMILAHEYGHYIYIRPNLQGPAFERVSAMARVALNEREPTNARLEEEIICDFIGFENLIFQQSVFRIADWRIALAITWLEMLSTTAGVIFQNFSYGSQSDRMKFKVQFFRTSSRPEIGPKCLHVGIDVSGLLIYAFFPKISSCQRLLLQAAKA